MKGEDAGHHFSFSSSPTEKGYIEFTKRITASDFSQALDSLQPGARAHLSGPMGTFTLPRTLRPLAFLSGGIGITPLRSMLRYIADKRLPCDVVLLYCNNSFAEIALRTELEQIAASHPGVRIEHVLPGPVPPGWKGKTGFVSRELVAEVVPDYRERFSTSPARRAWWSPSSSSWPR